MTHIDNATEPDRAVKHLVDTHFDGDFTKAMLSLSRQGDIAVAWMDREVIARHFTERGVHLTDELWSRIAPQLDDFDSYAGDAGSSVHTDYANCLLRQLGFDAAAESDPSDGSSGQD